jgi:hypothetical protein
MNPSILHRKETLVDSQYPEYATFAELTPQEEEMGLLSHADIGFLDQWKHVLAQKELQIIGHRLYRSQPS